MRRKHTAEIFPTVDVAQRLQDSLAEKSTSVSAPLPVSTSVCMPSAYRELNLTIRELSARIRDAHCDVLWYGFPGSRLSAKSASEFAGHIIIPAVEVRFRN